jgi:DNA (cytosine-5)-methyltransferase 1
MPGKESYNYLDLFSGIGGFAKGAYLAGMKFENHFFSEIDSFCVELYQKRFPDAIALGDITKIDTDTLKEKCGSRWIITGGFPLPGYFNSRKRKRFNR